MRILPNAKISNAMILYCRRIISERETNKTSIKFINPTINLLDADDGADLNLVFTQYFTGDDINQLSVRVPYKDLKIDEDILNSLAKGIEIEVTIRRDDAIKSFLNPLLPPIESPVVCVRNIFMEDDLTASPAVKNEENGLGHDHAIKIENATFSTNLLDVLRGKLGASEEGNFIYFNPEVNLCGDSIELNLDPERIARKLTITIPNESIGLLGLDYTDLTTDIITINVCCDRISKDPLRPFIKHPILILRSAGPEEEKMNRFQIVNPMLSSELEKYLELEYPEQEYERRIEELAGMSFSTKDNCLTIEFPDNSELILSANMHPLIFSCKDLQKITGFLIVSPSPGEYNAYIDYTGDKFKEAPLDHVPCASASIEERLDALEESFKYLSSTIDTLVVKSVEEHVPKAVHAHTKSARDRVSHLRNRVKRLEKGAVKVSAHTGDDVLHDISIYEPVGRIVWGTK